MEQHKAFELAIQLMAEHNLTQQGWRFEFDRSKLRFGHCLRKAKMISLSKPLTELNNEAQVKDTILHEIAHALTIGGHKRDWKLKAISIGCNGNRCYNNRETITPTKSYIGNCPGCGRQIKRFNRRRIACASCGKGQFNLNYLFVWHAI